jgi:hypothetical protein
LRTFFFWFYWSTTAARTWQTCRHPQLNAHCGSHLSPGTTTGFETQDLLYVQHPTKGLHQWATRPGILLGLPFSVQYKWRVSISQF